MMVFKQLQRRRSQLGKTLQSLASLTAMSVPQISNVLSGKLDSRLSTVETLANAMDASLVLIPKHLLPEILRLLSGKTIGPDNVPSTVDRFWGGFIEQGIETAISGSTASRAACGLALRSRANNALHRYRAIPGRYAASHIVAFHDAAWRRVGNPGNAEEPLRPGGIPGAR